MDKTKQKTGLLVPAHGPASVLMHISCTLIQSSQNLMVQKQENPHVRVRSGSTHTHCLKHGSGPDPGPPQPQAQGTIKRGGREWAPVDRGLGTSRPPLRKGEELKEHNGTFHEAGSVLWWLYQDPTGLDNRCCPSETRLLRARICCPPGDKATLVMRL